MVRLTKIYTKTGDDGLTGLVDGSRRPKYDLRVVAYGTVDEANAALGLAALYLDPPLSDMIKHLQNDLFDLGAELASPGETPRLHITPQQVERLERDIDTLNADLQPLNSFVLPGGTAGAAHLHLPLVVTLTKGCFSTVSCDQVVTATIPDGFVVASLSPNCLIYQAS